MPKKILVKNKPDGNSIKALLQKADKSSFPKNIAPMLATLVDKPFDEEGWLYEVKWDGYRAVAYLNKGEVNVCSRNNKSFNEKFYPVYNALQQWKINAVLDGEIIVINDKGISDFGGLQQWRSEADGELIFYLFDILWLEGYDLMQLSLAERKEILNSIAPQSNIIRLSESFQTGATDFFEVAKKLHLEGIIAKKITSIYKPGFRTKEWLKIKTQQRQEMVIGGYTKNENTSRQFSALLMGVYDDKGDFNFVTPVGTGFSNKLQTELLQKFKPLIIKDCPFKIVPEYNKPSRFRPNPPKATVTWVKPKLIAEISYAEQTSDGAIRHPSFEGLREDKSAKEVTREKEKSTEAIVQNESKIKKEMAIIKEKKVVSDKIQTTTKSPQANDKKPDNNLESKLFKAPSIAERKTLLNPKDKSQTRTINGYDITFNNVNKIYYPAFNSNPAVTKRDVINYYYKVAPFILPYMKDRPQTLIRYPNGITGESFYQKDVTGKVPDWIKLFPYSSDKGGNRNFLVCTNEASLLLIASMGGLEMHPWSSRVQKPDNPDWCIIDLDPDKNDFNQVIEAALVTKQVLDAVDVPNYCKTSGSTGLHIFIPLGAKYIYEESKEFARVLVKIIHKQIPKFTSIERLTEKRKGCIYLDFLQNRPQATLAAPYSLRPKPGASVSMPLPWEEVKKGLKIQQFNIFNAVDKIKQQGDIFKGVLGKGINMKEVLKKIQSVFGNPDKA
jgi:bifunctional non-homologous end joining protein LigD